MLIPWPSIQTQQTQEWNKRWKHNSDKQLSVRSFVTSSIYIITTQKGICSIHYTNPRKQWSCIPVATWTVPIKFKHIWLRAIPITNKLGIKQLSSLLTNYNRFHKLNFCHTNGMVQQGIFWWTNAVLPMRSLLSPDHPFCILRQSPCMWYVMHIQRHHSAQSSSLSSSSALSCTNYDR